MALVVADRVQETCSSPGTGTATLLGAVSQFRAFSSAIGNGNTTFYVIADQSGINWEVGTGTYTSAGNTLTRTTILSSSNGGALVNFSSGTQNVWNDYPAGYAIYASNNASQAIGQTLISGGVGVAPAWGNATSPPGSPGYYGQFYDTTIQTATLSTVAYLVGCATTSISNGVSISAGRITVANAGIYNFQFSIQLANPTASIAETSFWVRYNSVDIADSSSTTGVPIKHGGINGQMILSLNQVFNMAAGDYLELWWHSNVAGVLIETLPATLSPVVPQSPGVILTMLQQAQIGIGYNGLTSATSTLIATGSKVFTTNLTNSQTAFAVGTRVRVAYSVTPANFMEGVVTAFSGTTFTVNVDAIGGSGTFASWTISVAGIAGTAGGGSSTLTISNKTAAYTVIAGDNGTVLNWTSGTFTATLTAAATLGAGFNVWIWNTGTGVVTIDTNLTETIDGIDPVLKFNLTQGSGIRLVCNGTGWYSTDVRMSGSAAVGVGAVKLGRNSTGADSVAIAQGAVALGGSYASGAGSFAACAGNNGVSYGATAAGAIAIGSLSKASGSNSVSLGTQGVASGYYSFASGHVATASSTGSFAYGATTSLDSATSSGVGAVAFGSGSLADKTGKFAFASDNYWSPAGSGTAQYGLMVLRRNTTDATAGVLVSETSGTASAINQVILNNNSAFTFTGTIVARQKAANGTASAAWKIEGLIRREGTAASTTLVASTVTAISNVPAWTLALTADTTYGGLAVTATGAAATNIRWVATISSSELTYA